MLFQKPKPNIRFEVVKCGVIGKHIKETSLPKSTLLNPILNKSVPTAMLANISTLEWEGSFSNSAIRAFAGIL